MDLKEMKAKGSEICDEIDALTEQYAAEGDAAKLEDLDKKIAGKKAEFAKLEKQIEHATDMVGKRAALAAAQGDGDAEALEPEPKTKPAAKAIDHRAHERAKTTAFCEHLMGKSVPEQLLTELKPTSPAALKTEAAQEGGIVMPASMMVGIFGKRSLRMFDDVLAKAIPVLSTDANASGLIPEDFRRELLMLDPEVPHIMDRATVVPSPTGTITWPALTQTDSSEYGGVAVTWISEGASKSETEPTFEQIQVSTNEVAAYTELSLTLIRRSAIALEQVLTRLFRGAIQDNLDSKFMQGTGTGQPLGIINTTGIHTPTRAVANSVSYTDLVNLEFALQAYHRAGATFIVTDGALKTLKLALDSQNRPLWVPSVAGNLFNALVGYPYIGTHRLPSLGTQGDVVFVDLREYIVSMEEDIVVSRSDHFKFRNNLAAFRVSMQVGGKLVQPRTCAILDDAVTT